MRELLRLWATALLLASCSGSVYAAEWPYDVEQQIRFVEDGDYEKHLGDAEEARFKNDLAADEHRRDRQKWAQFRERTRLQYINWRDSQPAAKSHKKELEARLREEARWERLRETNRKRYSQQRKREKKRFQRLVRRRWRRAQRLPASDPPPRVERRRRRY